MLCRAEVSWQAMMAAQHHVACSDSFAYKRLHLGSSLHAWGPLPCFQMRLLPLP